MHTAGAAGATLMKTVRGTSKNLLRAPIAALGGARSLAYLFDMSRSLRSGRLALGPLVTVFRGALRYIYQLNCVTCA
jgi:hypothetical protein